MNTVQRFIEIQKTTGVHKDGATAAALLVLAESIDNAARDGVKLEFTDTLDVSANLGTDRFTDPVKVDNG